MRAGARILLPLGALAVLVLVLWGMDAFAPRAPDDAGERPHEESEGGKAPGLLGTTNPKVDSSPADEGDASEEEGEPRYAITGRVIDAENGAPVPGVAVFVFPRPWGIHRFDLTAQTVSGPDGSYRVNGLRPEDSDQCAVAMGAGWISRELATESREDRAVLPTAEAVAGDTYRLDLHVVRAARLEGRILLPDGAPAAGAEVRGLIRTVPDGLMMVRSFTSEDLIQSVQADADGRFVLASVAAAKALRVEARSSGYAWTLSPPVETALGRSSSVEIQLRRPRRAILKVVSAKDGSPVEGATVRTRRIRTQEQRREWPFEDPTDLVRTSDAQGGVDLSPLPSAPVRFSVKAPGYQLYASPQSEDAFEQVLQPVAGSTLDYTATIRLEQAGIVSGRIIAPDGVPANVFSVDVRALDAPGNERTYRFELVEDDGTFRVELPLTGLYKLEADGSFDGKSYAATMEVRPGDSNLEVRPVFDGEDSSTRDIPEPKGPVNWWDVEVVGPQGKLVKRVWLSVMPPKAERVLYGTQINPRLSPEGGTGRYRVPVRPDTRGVWLEADFIMLEDGTTGAPRVVGPLDGGGGKLTIQLERAGTICGVVLGTDGKPLQGQRVLAVPLEVNNPPEGYFRASFSEDARTDADGRFTVRGLANTDHVVWLRPQKGLVPQAPVHVRTGRQDLVLRTKPPVVVTITVRAEDGAPMAGARVEANIDEDVIDAPDQGERNAEAVTDAQGRCQLSGLDDVASYDLYVRVRSDGEAFAEEQLESWRPADTTVVLKRLHTLSGRVESPTGEPIDGALVTLDVEGARPASVRTKAGGVFVFDGREAGTGRLRATWHEPASNGTLVGAASETVAVRMGQRDVVLRLPLGRDLSVHIQNVSSSWGLGRRLRVAPIGGPEGARVWLEVGASGKVLCRGLDPVRSYYVWFGPSETGRYAYGKVGPNQDSITLPAEQGGEVTVRVTWPEGAEPAEVCLSGPGFYIDADRKDDGTYEIRGVPPGTWRVTATARLGGEMLSAERDAAAGASVAIEVRGQ